MEADRGIMDHPQTKQRSRLYPTLPLWAKVLVPFLLLASLTLNVIALLPGVPFMEIVGAVLPGPYSILKVIQLLWEHHLYPLVILVVGFSVLFPPLKLTLATVALVRPMTPRGRERMLGALGHLGRWSLLDVFVSLLILLVLGKQGLTGVTVKYGLYCFTGAIILSMIAGTVLHEIVRQRHPKPSLVMARIRPTIIYAGWQGVVSTVLCIGAVVVIGRAFFYPLFHVNQFGMVSNAWSLKDGIAYLFEGHLSMFAVVMGLFLIVAPLVTILLLLISLYVPLSNTYRRRTYLWTRYVSEWCMLDVFALAMMLYLSEQNNFVELTLLNGLWYLFGAVVVFTASLLWAEYASWRATSHRVSQIHDPTTLIGDAAAAAAKDT